MRTAGSSPYKGVFVRLGVLPDRDPQTDTPLPQTGSDIIQRPLPLWTEWQTCVKALPCTKLRLRALKISFIRLNSLFFRRTSVVGNLVAIVLIFCVPYRLGCHVASLGSELLKNVRHLVWGSRNERKTLRLSELMGHHHAVHRCHCHGSRRQQGTCTAT